MLSTWPDSWLINSLLFAVGVAILVKGSDWLVTATATVAHRRRWNPTIVGLTLLSFGTSLPELATNLYAIRLDQEGVALGNVIGSNIANILLIMGLCVSCLGRVGTDQTLFRRDTMVMLGMTLIFAALCYTGMVLRRWEGALLLVLLALYLRHLLQDRGAEVAEEASHAHTLRGPLWQAGGLGLVGLVMLVLGAKLMIESVSWAGARAGIAPELIGATVVAIGTSLPELAVTIAGILRKHTHLAMGNIVGSNIFNLVGIMGVTASLTDIPVAAEAAWVLLPVLLLSTVVMVVAMRTSWALVRWEGMAMLGGYLGFVGYNVARVIP